MFMTIKRKQLTGILIIIVVITVIGLFVSNDAVPVSKEHAVMSDASASGNMQSELIPGEAVMVNAPNSNDDFLTRARTDREIVRSKALEILNNTISNESASEQFRRDAEAQIIRTASDMDKEKRIETLLSAKGFERNVVFISQDGTTVTLDHSELSETDVAKINDIVFEQTGNNNIKIVEVE